jgi:secreted trypsin-like serine protease
MNKRNVCSLIKVPLLFLSLLMLGLAVGLSPVQAITWGEEDSTNTYPNVGLMGVFGDEGPIGFCSGTLIGPDLVLTAGHCTDYALSVLESGMATFVAVTFDPVAGPSSGTWYPVSEIVSHPDYNWGPTSDPHDVGLLVLQNPVSDIDPAALPTLGFLNNVREEGLLGAGRNAAKFTVVGYGATLDWPPPEIQFTLPPIRRIAESQYSALLAAWLRVSSHPKTGNSGTCMGDSGGPIFWEGSNGDRILVGITSWGDANCLSMTFHYRTDILETLDFIAAQNNK